MASVDCIVAMSVAWQAQLDAIVSEASVEEYDEVTRVLLATVAARRNGLGATGCQIVAEQPAGRILPTGSQSPKQGKENEGRKSILTTAQVTKAGAKPAAGGTAPAGGRGKEKLARKAAVNSVVTASDKREKPKAGSGQVSVTTDLREVASS